MKTLPTSPSAELDRPAPRLSICVSTLNRASFLRATVENFIPQLTDECELLVVDNASTDDTPRVMSELAQRCKRVRYVRKDTNNGLDSNFDRAVELARGDYCWLMSDDDLVKLGAVAAVLDALRADPSAVLVNYEFRDLSMSKILQDRVLDFSADRIYGAWELDRMFVELGDSVRYIGVLVMKREIWLARRRELHFGSCYAFVGMFYQERFPRSVHVITKPYVSYRLAYDGSGYFREQLMEVMLAKWPSLIASLPLSDAAKSKLDSAQPWKHFFELLFWRGIGVYTFGEYRRWLRPQLRRVKDRWIPTLCAALPSSCANLLLWLYLTPRRGTLRQMRGLQLALLEASPLHFRNWWSHRPRRQPPMLPADAR